MKIPKLLLMLTISLPLLLICYSDNSNGLANANTVIKNKGKNMHTIKAALTLLPYKIDSTSINSVSDYMVMEHLALPLVAYNTQGELTGVLAKKWDIENNYTKYTFHLDHNTKFSDGTIIKAHHVVDSIKRSMREDRAVHYDFSNIKDIRANGDDVVILELKDRNPFLLYDLEHPEFRVLSDFDITASKHQQKFHVTSGAYSLVKIDKKNIVLKKNPHYFYYNQHNKDAAEELVLIDNTDITKDKKLFSKVSPDIFWAPSQLDNDFHQFLDKEGYKKKVPRLGFTYWLSLNANSSRLQNVEYRKYLQKLLKIDGQTIKKTSVLLDEANELYLTNGPGRLHKNEVIKFWGEKNINKPKDFTANLDILIFKHFKLTNQIVTLLKDVGIKATVHYYDNFTQYAELIKQKDKYDIVQVNMDFSSIDLRGSLDVSFNEARPLILLEKGNTEIKELLNKINTTIEDEKRFAYVEKIGRIILEKGYLVPLYYFNTLVYYKPNLNLDDWSDVVTDVGIWKAKPLKK